MLEEISNAALGQTVWCLFAGICEALANPPACAGVKYNSARVPARKRPGIHELARFADGRRTGVALPPPRDFAVSSAYNLVDLRTDLNRFTFLFGTGDREGSVQRQSRAGRSNSC
jgi:hypothetical protein